MPSVFSKIYNIATGDIIGFYEVSPNARWRVRLELIQISNTSIMDNQKYKLEKLKKTQKAKSRKDELFNSYLNKTNKVEDKIALIKFKQKDDNSLFLSSLKTLMKR